MCGIIGFNQENQQKIQRLTELLHHRGPDQYGFHIGNGVSLGHRRLSILDLSTKGQQPLYNEDRSICVVFNGEIYNFKELKKRLIDNGHHFDSHTDTEVLVHGYEEWGSNLPEHLNGQFAFCIFDQPNQKLFLARDRFGIKPLYFSAYGGNFFFCSELKCFLESSHPKEIDPESLDYFLLFGFMPTGKSILKNVNQLLPGQRLLYCLQSNQVNIDTYWNWRFEDQSNLDENQVIAELPRLLENSVKNRLISDVPLGAFLSGGLDSSILVALMRKHVDDLKTFSIQFDYQDFNESHYAKIVSKQYETEHYEIRFTAQNVRDLIPKLAYHYDEPFADSSMIPTWLVSTVAKEHVTVCLSGTGGDELFAGYDRYHEYQVLHRLNCLPSPLRASLDMCISIGNRFLKNDKLSKLRTFLQRPLPDQQLYAMLFSYMFRSIDESHDLNSLLKKQDLYFSYTDPLENMLNYDVRVYLPDCLFIKEDRASMGNSLEVRVPFLDHEFAEYVFRLPTHLKMNRGQQKYILKKAFSHLLPDEILYRKKQGFGVPLAHYFRKELRDFSEQILFDSVCEDYFDTSLLKSYWQRHQNRQSDYSRIFWSVIMFKLWYQQWMR